MSQSRKEVRLRRIFQPPSHPISCFVDPRMESFQTGSQSYATRGLHFPKARWGTRGSGIQHEPCGTSIRWLKHRPRSVPSQHLNPVRLQQRLQIEPMLAAWGLHSAGLTRLPLTWCCKYGNHHPALRVTRAAPLKWYTANHETPSRVFSCTSRCPAGTLTPKLFQNRI